MINIIIVGAGGFAKELYSYIKMDVKTGYLNNCHIKGFLDVNKESFEEMGIRSTYLGTDAEYIIQDGDKFIVAVGDTELKEKITSRLLSKKASFMSYIHSTSIVDESAKIGEGVIVCPFCMVNSHADIGDYSMLNIYSSVAHDSTLGKFSILSPYATFNGNVKSGKKLFMATRSTILPGVTVGDSCIVAAGAVVAKDMIDNIIAFPKTRTTYVERKIENDC